jgi:hypothetical protein
MPANESTREHKLGKTKIKKKLNPKCVSSREPESHFIDVLNTKAGSDCCGTQQNGRGSDVRIHLIPVSNKEQDVLTLALLCKWSQGHSHPQPPK